MHIVFSRMRLAAAEMVGVPPPRDRTASPPLFRSLRKYLSSRILNPFSPSEENISGMGRFSPSTMVSSRSIKRIPSISARTRPTELLPLPINPSSAIIILEQSEIYSFALVVIIALEKLRCLTGLLYRCGGRRRRSGSRGRFLF